MVRSPDARPRPGERSAPSAALLYVTSFVCGGAIMLLEVVGFRLLPPHFGYSMPVWGALLGVVMAALTVGYYAGGRLADRRPEARTLYLLILVAGVYGLGLLATYPTILRGAARLGLVGGAGLASLLLFAVPMAALSTVSPFLTRLLAREGELGRTAGTVYAVSTVGSIAGTFLTSFYLVPTIGTRASLVAAVATLGVVGGVGLLASRGRAAAAARRPASPAAAAPAARPGAPARLPVVPASGRVRLELTAAGCLALGVVASGFAPPVLFELTGRDEARWTERFAAGEAEAVVDAGEEGGRVPYILPGPADEWAGRKAHRIRIRFAAPPRDARLVLRVPSQAEPPPRLAVTVNGHEVSELRLRRAKAAAGPPREYVVRIPAGVLDAAGAQTLGLTNRQGGWVRLATVTVQTTPATFSAAHFLDPSPPPLWALAAFALGLVGLWIADGARVRGNLAAVTVLGGALALLGFLALAAAPVTADWSVVLLTHRGIWLLLILSFALPLAPRLPRLPSLGFPPVAAFVTGAVVMILEIAGFRLLSPFFGYSIYVWGAILGTVMAALAAGYYVGGWLADRRSPEAALHASLLATAVLVLGTLHVYPAIVRLTFDLPLVGGSLAAAALLLFVPIVGVGMATPLLVRLAVRAGDVGVTVGRIYAAATVGSLAGTFAASFVLVTGLGPQEAWTAAGIVLLGLLSAHGVARGGLAGVHWLGLLLVFAQPLAPEISVAALKGGTRIYETESEYSHLEVIELGKTLQLVPSLRFVHTIYDEDEVLDPVMTYGLLPSLLVERPRTMLHLGMGGGTLSRAYLHAYPELRVHGVDIDPEMIQLGRRFLGLRDDPRLSISIEDGRAYLLREPADRYDVIVWDLFQGGVFVPYYALTREFFESARARLTDRGVLALFIARPRAPSGSGRDAYARLYQAVGNTLAAVFPSVAAYPVTRIGYYFLATRDRMPLETMRARLLAADHEAIHGPLRAALRGLAEYRPEPTVPVLTDDLAPVDQLIYDAFFRQEDED